MTFTDFSTTQSPSGHGATVSQNKSGSTPGSTSFVYSCGSTCVKTIHEQHYSSQTLSNDNMFLKKTIKPMPSATENLSRDAATVAASLSAMMEKELTAYSCTGYLNLNMNQSSPPTNSNPNTMVTSNDRMALVDWCYGVVDHCQYSRETVASAMDMVDRFLSTPSSTADEALRSPDLLQLLVVTALYVAIKLNERVVMSSELFAEITRYVYTVEEIEDMERTLLSGLSWRCCAPTASQIGHSILSLILPYADDDTISEATWGYLMDEMIYQIEYAVRDCYFCTQRASTIALAAICNAVKDGKQIRTHEHRVFLEALPRIKESFSFDSTEVVVAACKRLQVLQDNVQEADDVVPEASSSKYTEVRSVVELELHLLS